MADTREAAGSKGTLAGSVEATIDLRRESAPSNIVDPEATLALTSDQITTRMSDDLVVGQGQCIGRFELRRQLGQGSFGVVYLAYDPALDREVALKVPRFAAQDEHEIERFFREAKAAARLRHPNIVAVFESGKVGNSYYIATEFVDGESLADRLKREPPPLRESVNWVQELAGAMAYAHGKGIIHRDIKPANIMIGKGGRPQLMDFGLAKSQRAHDAETSKYSVVGTPSYMSPEQARGDVQLTGPLSDQYSLGAVLYQVLTGNRPYSGSTSTVVSMVSDVRVLPPSPTSMDPSISKDLEACCLRAMKKDPGKRYASSLEFAADLRRWLRDEPVHARPLSAIERLGRWCHRHQAIASLTAAIAMLLFVGSIAATTAAVRFSNLAERERIAANKAEVALSDSYANSGLVASNSGESAQAVLWFANAASQARHDRTRELVRVRNWCHSLPLPIAVLPDQGRLKQMAFHPGGRYLLTISIAKKLLVWDLEVGKAVALPTELESANAATWNADGDWLAIGHKDRVVLWSFPDGKQRREIAHAGEILAVEFSADGKNLAIGGDFVRVWNIKQQQFVSPVLKHPKPVPCLVFNSRGDRLVTAAEDELARVFGVGSDQSAEPLYQPLPNLSRFTEPQYPVKPCFIDDDNGLLTKSSASEATWWNVATGEKVRPVPAARAVINIARSGDGKRFVVCDFKLAQLWDVSTGDAIFDPLPHANFVYSATFFSDGKTAITASADRKVGLWDTASGNPRGPMLAHQSEVEFLVAAPTADRFASAQIDGLVRVWQLSSRDSSFIRDVPIAVDESYVTLSNDGRWMVPGGWNLGRSQRTVSVYEVSSGAAVKSTVELPGMVNQVALSPEGTRFVTIRSLPANLEKFPEAAVLTQQPGVVEFWSRRSQEPNFQPITTPTEPIGVAWSSDDKSIGVICGGGQIILIDAQTGKTRHEANQEATMVPRYMIRDWIRFAPDGQTLVTWGLGSLVRVWDVTTGALKYDLKHGERCHDVKFSPQGDVVATMSMDGTVRVWNAKTGESLAQLRHPDWVFTGEFSRDGRRLLTACRDRMARLWDWKQGKLVCPAMEHADEVFGVAFADEERMLLTCSRDGKVQWWDSHIGKPLARPLTAPAVFIEVAVTSDEKYAVVAGSQKALTVVRLQDLSKPISDEMEVNDLRRFGELLSGQRVHEGGGVVNLTTQEWLECWRVFNERHPQYEQLVR